MNIALYATSWLSVLLFVAGEAGKQRAVRRGLPLRGAWLLWAVGALLCAAHMTLAMGVRYDWSHQAAIESTARQTQAVYGVNWRGGVYVNYAFLALWIAEVMWWRASPRRYLSRPAATTWIVRSFYLLVLFNAAVVFASGARAVAGVLLIAFLLWIWRPGGR